MTNGLTHVGQALAALIARGALPAAAVALLDTGGREVLLWRSPEIGFFYAELASAKAWTAAALGRTPTETGQRLDATPATAAYLAAIGGGRFAPLEGGGLYRSAGAAPCALGVASPQGRQNDIALVTLIAEAAGLVAMEFE